jgi:hypothetical protein
MGRPKLKNELKRTHVSISVKKTIEDLADIWLAEFDESIPLVMSEPSKTATSQ